MSVALEVYLLSYEPRLRHKRGCGSGPHTLALPPATSAAPVLISGTSIGSTALISST
jgi:hypothetical protein